MTVEQAQALIGKLGNVINPGKGITWEGRYKVVGYKTNAEGGVTGLKAESEAWTLEVIEKDDSGKIIRQVAPHPRVTAHDLNPTWFRLDESAA